MVEFDARWSAGAPHWLGQSQRRLAVFFVKHNAALSTDNRALGSFNLQPRI
jgi:hypothetical protein